MSSGATMSKDETGCKLSSVYKHKERKPKKPHYIPRPWGKPYNYKCFQCPFTCMEKSHLYNHMKYSLCKNSLSLLIESDWPYKKGNLLHPELRLLQPTEAIARSRGRPEDAEICDSVAVASGTVKHVVDKEGGPDKLSGTEDLASERMNDEPSQFPEEEEDEEEMGGLLQEAEPSEKKVEGKEASPSGDGIPPEASPLLFQLKSKKEKACKDPSPDFIITDVFSLKKHMVKGKEPSSFELEVKPKHCKGPKKCPASSAVIMDQWKLVANGQRRGVNEVPTPCPDGNIIPCYPPPVYGEYHEPQSLNLSLLGINYPLNPNLFSYLSPSVANSATPHPHLNQLPFLASTAQLMPPQAAHFQPLQSSERSAFLPRFYYPLLFEHSFGAAENKMAAVKPEAQQQNPGATPAPPQAKTPTETTKAGLLKVPILKAGFPWAKGFREEPPPAPEQSHKALLLQAEEGKWLIHEKESNAFLGVSDFCRKPVPDAYRGMVGLRDGATLLPNSARKPEVPVTACLESGGTNANHLKRKYPGNGHDRASADLLTPGKTPYQASMRTTPTQLSKSLDHWHMELYTCPSDDQDKTGGSDVVSPTIPVPDHLFFKPRKEHAITVDPRDPEATTVLIGDLSKTLEEYQEVEKKLSDLSKEDTPAQKQLRDQLVKIRQELFHIHQALEKVAKPSEGPLDLSLKRSSKGLEKGHQEKKELKIMLSGGRKLQGKDQGPINGCSMIGEAGEDGEASSCPLEIENKTIDLLIKMSHAETLRASSSEAHLGTVIKAEVLPLGVPLELRQVMEPYYSRTTKCEADSSVLLCTDGRSNPSQGPQLSMTEDVPLGCRPIPRSLSSGLPSETDGICLHSPLHTDP